MLFSELDIDGAVAVAPERFEDERGFFARTWCADEFAAQGLDVRIAQSSVSFNHAAGTLRGMHWQDLSHPEIKLVRCTRGAVTDVIVDVRPDSPTYLAHCTIELTAENGVALYIPAGVAHGFITHADDTELLYQMTTPHTPEAARGARWNDPAFGVDWPAEPKIMNERDRTYPDFAS